MHDGDEMNPVAWKSTLQTDWYISNEKMLEDEYDANYWIPLYTAPRELSDDEIMDIWYEVDYDNAVINFARTILKKAIEK